MYHFAYEFERDPRMRNHTLYEHVQNCMNTFTAVRKHGVPRKAFKTCGQERVINNLAGGAFKFGASKTKFVPRALHTVRCSVPAAKAGPTDAVLRTAASPCMAWHTDRVSCVWKQNTELQIGAPHFAEISFFESSHRRNRTQWK